MAKKTETQENAMVERNAAEMAEVPTTAWIDDGGNSILLSDGEERKYWHVQPGEVISGAIIDYTTLDGSAVNPEDEDSQDSDTPTGKRTALVIEIDRPCAFVIAGSEVPEIAKPGDIVYVGMRHGLRAMVKYLVGTAIPHAQICATGKVKLKTGGKTAWRFRIAMRPTARKRVPMSHQLPASLD